jgi:hypothetical protein
MRCASSLRTAAAEAFIVFPFIVPIEGMVIAELPISFALDQTQERQAFIFYRAVSNNYLMRPFDFNKIVKKSLALPSNQQILNSD